MATAALAVAAALRLARVPTRWDEVAWLYSAYPGHTVDALAAGDLVGSATSFTGLHPPLWPLLHAASELLAPVPLLWLLGSALASWLAVWAVARADAVAGLVLAGSAIQIHYAAEVNQYPLAVAWVGLAWGLRGAVADGRRGWGWMALAVAGAGWTHALAGLSAVAAAATLPWPLALRVLGASALSAAPLAPGVVAALSEPGTFRQPPFAPDLVLADLRARFGLWGLLLAPFAAAGARRAPRVAAAAAAVAVALCALIAAGVAAPHQFPYLLFLGPPVALLVGAGARSRAAIGAVAVVVGASAAGALSLDLAAWRAPDPRPRAIDVALDELEARWSCPAGAPPTPACAGDALVLISPAGPNDDDKRASSTVLRRLPPWLAMPRVRPYTFDHADHRHGQPRLVRGHAVYVHDHLRETLSQLVAAHPRVRVVVYGQGRRPEFTTALQATLGASPVAVGEDHLYRLPAAPP